MKKITVASVAGAASFVFALLPLSINPGSDGVRVVGNKCAAAAVGERCDLLTDYICSGPPPLGEYYDAVCVSGCGAN